MVYDVIPLIALGLNILMLSLLVAQRPHTSLQRIFIVFLVGMAAWMMSIFVAGVTNPAQALYWEDVAIGLLAVISVSFLHFVNAFSGTANPRWILAAAYVFVIAVITTLPFGLIVSGIKEMWYGNEIVAGPLLVPFGVIFYAFMIYALWRLFVYYRRSESNFEKSRYVYIFLGGGVSLFGFLIDALNASGVVQIYPMAILTNTIFILLASYAVLNHSLLDYRIVIRRGATYAIVSGLIFGLAMGLISLIYNFGIVKWELSSWTSVALIIVLGIALQPVLRVSQNVIDRWFSRKRIDYLLVLENLSKEIKTITDLRYITSSLVDTIADTLHCRNVTLMVPDPDEKCFITIADRGMSGVNKCILPKDSILVKWLEKHEMIVNKTDLMVQPDLKELTESDRDTIRELETELVVPLADRNSIRGILILGKKISDQKYLPEEIRVLEIMGRQMAATLDNARLYHQQIRRYQEQALLAKLSTRISAEFNQEKIYHYCSFELKKLMSVDYFGVSLETEDGQRATVFNNFISDGPDLSEDINHNLALIDAATLCSEPGYRQYSDLDSHKSVIEEVFYSAGLKTLVLLPLISKKAPFGVLAIGSFKLNAYERQDIELVKHVALEMAIGIEKSRLYESERKARLELEKKDRERTDLVNALVHEINTPLTAILASSELLHEELSGKDTIDALAENLDVAAHNLNNRIMELMDYSKLQTETMKLDIESLDLFPIVRSIAAQVLPLLKNRNQTLEINLLDIPVIVQADRDRITQILLNLLNNAIKFTEPNLPISVDSYAENGSIVLAVTDSATPISAEEAPLLFQPYYRRNRGKGSGGLGLGLSICKKLVEKQGGKIWVEPGETGNTFKFSLPVQQQTENKK